MKFRLPLAALTLACGLGLAHAGPLDKTECIAPAKPGGGFDLTCKLAQSSLLNGKYISDPMRVTYMPGGIGAVAINNINAQRRAGVHDRERVARDRRAAAVGLGAVQEHLPRNRARREPERGERVAEQPVVLEAIAAALAPRAPFR